MLSKLQVLHIAKLANLPLSSAEVKKFRKQLSDILDYINLLEELNTKDVEPTSQVTGLENVVRKDEAGETLTQKEAPSGASRKKNGHFEVGKVLENN